MAGKTTNANIPMKSRNRAQPTQSQQDGGGVSTPLACAALLLFIGVGASRGFAVCEGRCLAARRFSWNSHGIRGFCRGFRVDLNPDKITPLPGIRESACLVRFSSIRHTSARSASRIKGVLVRALKNNRLTIRHFLQALQPKFASV